MSVNGPNDQVTTEILSTNGDLPASDLAAFAELFEEGQDDEWVVANQPGRLRLRIPTTVLIVAILCAGAFWGGAAVEKSQGATSARAGATTTGSAASRVAGTGGTTGTSAAAAPTTGLVTDLQGDTLYVTNSSGNLVKVLLGASTVITRDATATAAALQPGDTVVVEGTTASNGTVTATSVSATAAGVSSSGSSYSGGFGGARSSTSSTTTTTG